VVIVTAGRNLLARGSSPDSDLECFQMPALETRLACLNHLLTMEDRSSARASCCRAVPATILRCFQATETVAAGMSFPDAGPDRSTETQENVWLSCSGGDHPFQEPSGDGSPGIVSLFGLF
jgi:hypothetical protein